MSLDLVPATSATVTAECGAPAAGGCATVALDALLPADSPRVDGENPEHVRALAQLERALPPILVHRATMRVVDGMHRLRAARLRGDESIEAEFFEGGEEDVFALAVRLNVDSGLPLSQADRTAATTRILRAHLTWSDRRIGAITGLAASTVAAIRRRSTGGSEQSNARVGRDGRVRPLRAADGRRRAGQIIAADPGASLREIAGRAGIAPATAKDVRDRIRQGLDPVPTRCHTPKERLPATAARRPVERDIPRAPASVAAALGPLLPNMRKDPSLRTDAGRLLLQMLSLHSIGDEAKWRRLAQSVPGHRTAVLVQAARRCADHWLRFANELETRRM
ncbi:hypothetical protein ACQB60_30920 [Actinomycetota bacterium Odt1-20B]